jgi:hypothetical protein
LTGCLIGVTPAAAVVAFGTDACDADFTGTSTATAAAVPVARVFDVDAAGLLARLAAAALP